MRSHYDTTKKPPQKERFEIILTK